MSAAVMASAAWGRRRMEEMAVLRMDRLMNEMKNYTRYSVGRCHRNVRNIT